jgi:hypothetical protein
MLATKVAIDITLLGTSLVIKYSDGSLQYEPMDKVVAMSSPHPDFYFDVLHRQGNLERGQTVTTIIDVVPTKKFKEQVTFKAVDPPADMNITFDPPTTGNKTTMTIRCGNTVRLGQNIIQIKATAQDVGIVREFDMILYVTQAGSGLGVNVLPQQPVDGQAAVLNTPFTTSGGSNVPANTPMQYMSHTGWTASPNYKGTFGNWDTISSNSEKGLTAVQHEYTNMIQAATARPRPNRRRA